MIKKFFASALFMGMGAICLMAQPRGISQSQKPKLVVGVVIDQMRWDYLYRFERLYSNDGFKRLLTQGFSFENTLIPYTPTYTAVGHTCVYTGSIPAITGIVGNSWFDKSIDNNMYCTSDSTVEGVGSKTDAGKMSPANMWTTSVTDELRLSNNFKSKVIGISLKDRGAILPAGHAANAAYWYDDSVGHWISSTYYFANNQLPQWVKDFNATDPVSRYMSQDWDLLKNRSLYIQADNDGNAFEGNISGEKNPAFPHRLSLISNKKKRGAIRTTPHGTSLSFEFAKAALINEQMGKGMYTDFLALSISSTDYIGHTFGPNSLEIEDAYARLDKDLASFLQFLDLRVGKGNYLFFLTADHAAAHNPSFLQSHKIPGGYFDDDSLKKEITAAVETRFAIKKAIRKVYNYQVYLNDDAIANSGKDADDVKEFIIQKLMEYPYILHAVELKKLELATINATQKRMMINGYNTKRSGDIQFTVKPQYMDHGKTGTTHGAWNPYDAHIPLLWYGWNIKPGETNREVYMTDIAPTVAALLDIQMPSGNVGKALIELTK